MRHCCRTSADDGNGAGGNVVSHHATIVAGRIQRRIGEQVYLSRKKDYDNPFRSATCRNDEEAPVSILKQIEWDLP